MTTLKTLPSELQIEIFGWLDAPGLKAVRTVCRTFRENVSPAQFRQVVACTRHQGLKCFQTITSHPKYASYVKEIVFDGTVYVQNLADNEDLYYRAQVNFKDLDAASQWSKRVRWKQYHALYREQEDLKENGVLMQILLQGLQNMPSLSSIVYSPHVRLLPHEHEYVRDLIPVGFICYPTALTRRGYTSHDHAFLHLIRAIYEYNSTKISRFKVERVRPREHATELSAEMFSLHDPKDKQAGLHLFSRLTDVELNLALRDLNTEHMVSFDQQSPSQLGKHLANLAELLAAARDLHHLALGITFNKIRSELYGPYIQVLKYICHSEGLYTTWANLQSLRLENIYGTHQEYIDFIKRHHNTLRSVTLTRCRLVYGVWIDVVDVILYDSDVEEFVLDRVNELQTDHPADQRKMWKYEGKLVLEDGRRTFVDTNPAKMALYHSRL